MRQAEALQLPLLIVSYKASRGVYRRLGFVEVGTIVKDDSAFGGSGEYSWHFLLWEPSASSKAESGQNDSVDVAG